MKTYNKKDIPEYLQKYFEPAELGLEPDFNTYISRLCNIFDEVKRVLKKEGTCWVVIGDTYSGNKEGKTDNKACSYLKDNSKGIKKKDTITEKSLCQIPSRFSLEMTRRRGYIVKTEIDEAWLGGIIEGEGCITIAEHRGYYEPRIQVAMVNKEVLEQIVAITGVGTVAKQTERNNPKWRDSYIWKVSGSTASKIGSDIFNYLFSKREQARILWRMVEMQNERVRTGGDPYSNVGQKYSEKQNAERKMWFEQIKAHNQGNGNPTGLKNPIKNEPWILRNSIIWHKPNAMPSPVKDRFTVDFEKIFFFVKNKKYWFEQQFDPYIVAMNRWGGEKLKANGASEWDEGTGQKTYRNRDFRPNKKGRNKRAVWSINTKSSGKAHFATYPEKLINPCILAGCPQKGVVLDPFMGSGTTGVVCKKLNRKFIGIELSEEYMKIAVERIKNCDKIKGDK